MKYLFILIGIFSFQLTYSQTDSLKLRKVEESFIKDDFSQQQNFSPVDTVISDFHLSEFDGFSNLVSLGNYGLGVGNILFNLPEFKFEFGEDEFILGNEILTDQKVYNTTIPFVRASYISGPRKYQNFNVFFTENINSTMNLAVQFYSFGSDGFYLNQSTTSRFVSIQNSYKSTGNKYGYFTKFYVKSGKANENGGIKGDSIFLSSLRGDKLNVQVWNDENSINHYDFRNFELHQFYRFLSSKGSLKGNSGLFILLDNTGYFKDLWYENELTDSLYFNQFNLDIPDSISLSDKAHLFGFDNQAAIKFVTFNQKLDVLFGYQFNVYNPENWNSDTILSSQKVNLRVNKFELKKFLFTGQIQKGVAGFNSDGHHFAASAERSFAKPIRMLVDFSSVKTLPEYKYLNYAGSVITWNNNFGYLNHNSLGLKISLDSINLSFAANGALVSNYVYFGSDTKPIQYSNQFSQYSFQIRKHFILKAYHFDISVIYQNVEESAPVNLPEWLWKVSFYFQRYLFDKALKLRYGIDYWQSTAYHSDKYAPFTRSFVYQNEYTVGDYPFLDFYISARVKSAQGFVKFQNLGQLVLDRSYMMVPYYPMQDFGISFGLRWDFYN